MLIRKQFLMCWEVWFMRWREMIMSGKLEKREVSDDSHDGVASSLKERQPREMKTYIEKLKEQIRNPKARQMAALEIQDHIDDQAEEYERQGMEREAAVIEAVKQMGDPVAAGVELDRIHRPRMNWPLFGIIACFSILGLILQYVCFYGMGDELLKYQPTARISNMQFYRQCAYTLLGLAVMTGVCFLDYSRIGTHSRVLAFVFLFGIWLACQTGGITMVNGNRSWFLLFPMRNGGFPYFKSILYLFVPLFGGILYKSRGEGYKGIAAGFLWIAAFMAVGKTVGGGMGGTIDVILVCIFLLFVAIGKGWYGTENRRYFFAAAIMICIIGGIIVLGRLPDYALHQLYGIRNRFIKDAPAGYLNSRIWEMVGNLALNGSSTAVLGSKNLLPWENISLSDIQYDFIFLQMASQLGIFKMLLLCLSLAGMLLGLFYAVIKQRNQMGQIMGMGCALILALETVRTILNNLGLYVASTNGLIFFSYGIGHTLVVYILLGVILSIYRYKDLVWERNGESMPRHNPTFRYCSRGFTATGKNS